MSPNSIPLVTGEWIIDAMRQRLNEIKSEAAALQTVTEQHALSADIEYTCREMLSGIQRLDKNLSQLEASVSQFRTQSQLYSLS
jgi:hypothetical protein